MPKRPKKPSSSQRPSPAPAPAPSGPNPSSDGRTPAEGGDTGAGLDASQAAIAAGHSEGEADAAIAALAANQKKAIIAVVLAVLLVVTYVIYGQVKEANHIAAAQAYTSAAEAGSIDSLNLVISTYGGTVAAGNALLSKAELEQTNEQLQQAAQAADKDGIVQHSKAAATLQKQIEVRFADLERVTDAHDSQAREFDSQLDSLPDYKEGYQQWHSEFKKGKAGVFTSTIAEGIEVLEKSFK